MLNPGKLNPDKLNATLQKTQHPVIRNMKWGFNLLAVSFIVFLAGYSWLSWQSVKQDQSNELASIAELSGNSLDSYFSHYEHSLKILAQELMDGQDSIKVTHSRLLLKKFLRSHPDLLAANVIHPDGQMLVSSAVLPGLPLPSQANAPSFITGRDELLKGVDFNIGRPFYGPLVMEWVIPLRYAVRDKKGGLLYILAASLPLARQQSFWHGLSLPENTALGLLRDDAYLISRYPAPDKTSLEEAYGKPRTGILVAYLKQHAFPVRGNVEGYNSVAKENYLFGFRRLSYYPVTLFVTTPISYVQAKWWQQVRNTYFLLLLFMLGGYFVYRWMVKNQLAWELDRELHEEKLRSIYEGSNDAIMLLDDKGFVDCNARTLEMFGLKDKAEFIGHHPAEFSPPVQPDGRASMAAAADAIAKALRLGRNQFEWMHRRKNGEDFPVEVLLSAFNYAGEKILQAAVRDITKRKKNQKAIRQLNTELSQFKSTLDQTLDCVFMFDPDTLRFTYVNEGAKRQVGYSGTELMQMTPPDLAPEFTLEQFRQAVQPLIDGVLPSLTFQTLQRHKDGHDVPVEAFLQLIRLEGQAPRFVAMVSDISDRKAAQEQIEFLAYHDVLTGLPNRLLAKNNLEQAILVAERENSKVALLFIDLDKFKTINDSLGHVIGDGLLKGVAIRLRECMRDIDTLSRQGGDEFLIVLNNMRDTESINVVAEKILERMAQPFEIDHHELSVSLSIGIAVYPDDSKDFDTLLKQADTAMYQGKDAGRNTHRFHTEQMNIDAVEHLRMRNGLRHALEHGEFVLHYQPQISLATGAVIGAEALIRWRHPELGMVPPGRFISIAEDSGLIVPIGDWVLREACRQAVAWRKVGLPELIVAVNLSAVQFKRGDVLKSVTQALVESGLDPALLELELTESILIKDTEKVLATVRQLKSLGLKLSIDDFGTGYSSLSYLKQFDVDKLKIDQSFVRDMADDPNDAAIVRAIIQMAKSLNLTTIAEGVEDERQLALLRLQHCDEVQGYHFARPMPADEFESFMARFIASSAK